MLNLNQSAWKLLQPILILVVIFAVGMVGYILIEGFNLVEAIYMTTISVTTAGFTEVRPLSEAGRLFTVFLLITSWCSFAFAITRITQYIINGEINMYFNGQQAAQTLGYHSQSFVVIENNPEAFERIIAEHTKLLIIQGNGTDDDILRKAGIHRAKALITTLPADADNVFIVLSARSLNPTIHIISRASDHSSYPKLIKAGANNVIMPDRIGGTHMATLVSKPDVVEFIDYLSGEEGESIHIESVAYEQLPVEIRGKSLREVMKWKKTGVNCIGVKNADGKFLINPPETITILPKMKVLVLGTRQQIEEMKSNIGD